MLELFFSRSASCSSTSGGGTGFVALPSPLLRAVPSLSWRLLSAARRTAPRLAQRRRRAAAFRAARRRSARGAGGCAALPWGDARLGGGDENLIYLAGARPSLSMRLWRRRLGVRATGVAVHLQVAPCAARRGSAHKEQDEGCAQQGPRQRLVLRAQRAQRSRRAPSRARSRARCRVAQRAEFGAVRVYDARRARESSYGLGVGGAAERAEVGGLDKARWHRGRRGAAAPFARTTRGGLAMRVGEALSWRGGDSGGSSCTSGACSSRMASLALRVGTDVGSAIKSSSPSSNAGGELPRRQCGAGDRRRAHRRGLSLRCAASAEGSEGRPGGRRSPLEAARMWGGRRRSARALGTRSKG